MSGAGEPARAQQFLGFSVAGKACAAPILRVHEILAYEPPTPVPHTPAFIRGLLNRRGSVLPVVDLAVKLGGPPSTPGPRSCVVVLEVEMEGERVLLGVLVDTVNEVLALAPADIEPPAAFGAALRPDFLQGMGRRGQGFVLLLELDRVLSASELALSGAPAAPAAA